MHWEYTLLGLLAGVLVGLTGVGGGSLVTPVLALFGIPTASAVGTDLVFAAITKSCGTVVHRARRSVDWRIVGLLAAGSCPAAALTVAMLAFGDLHITGQLIKGTLALALILTGLSLCLDRERVAGFARRLGGRLRPLRPASTVAAGGVLGVLVTLSSVGAGALGATFLTLLYPRLDARRIAGTDIAHAVPLTLIAGFGHFRLGNVDGALLASLLVGSVPGIVLASLLAGRLPERTVRTVLALVLMAVGARFGIAAA
jgi:uncharacterized membrane protein YfcA